MSNILETAIHTTLDTLTKAPSVLGWPQPMPGNNNETGGLSLEAQIGLGVGVLAAAAIAGVCLWRKCCRQNEATHEETPLTQPANQV